LWTAAQLELPIAFVIIKNGRYEALAQFGGLFGLQETVGTALPDIDFRSIAQGFGLKAALVTADALDEALRQTLAADGPALLEVAVD
jgi:benzoylformate decarboxylase